MIESQIKLVVDCKVSDRKILIVPINTLEFTPYNPSGRTKEGRALSVLRQKLIELGVCYPILITPDRKVIDGNRRATVWRDLGHTHIECIVADIDRDIAFTAVNTSSAALGGKGWLEMAHKGGHLSPRHKAQYDELLQTVGTWGVDLLIESGLGLNVLPLCKQVASLSRELSTASLLMKCAERKLTNKFNAVIRSDMTQEEKASRIKELIA